MEDDLLCHAALVLPTARCSLRPACSTIFLKERVRALVQAMADAFPGSVLALDAANEKAVKLMLKTWIKGAEIRNVGACFTVSDARGEIGAWDSRLQVHDGSVSTGCCTI